MVRVRAFGAFAARVTDPEKLLRELVGTDQRFRTDEVHEYLRQNVVSHLASVLASAGIPVVDLAAHHGDLGDQLAAAGTRRVMPEHLAELSPWPLEQAASYQPDYLAGYETLRYDVEPEAGLEVAKQEMAPVIENDCERDIGGDVQRVHHVATSYSAVTYKLLLLPVWIATYLYGGKPFQVLVNARTAEVVGQRPWSVWKITFAVLAVLALVGAIVWAVVASQDGAAASTVYSGLALLGDPATRESVRLYAGPGI